jgi:hypothetical protein
MQLPDEDPLLMFAWHLGKGFQHMRLDEEPGYTSAEFAALEKFWAETASINLNRENAAKLLELARAIHGFPAHRLESAEQQLARVPTDSTAAISV